MQLAGTSYDELWVLNRQRCTFTELQIFFRTRSSAASKDVFPGKNLLVGGKKRARGSCALSRCYGVPNGQAGFPNRQCPSGTQCQVSLGKWSPKPPQNAGGSVSSGPAGGFASAKRFSGGPSSTSCLALLAVSSLRLEQHVEGFG